jgi:hypothetical protein
MPIQRAYLDMLFSQLSGGETRQSEKNRIKQFDFFTLLPAAASYVRRVLHCDVRIVERERNLNFYHRRLAPTRLLGQPKQTRPTFAAPGFSSFSPSVPTTHAPPL